MSLWWLSFCDPKIHEGSQFLGACIIEGSDGIEAIRAAHRLGCNPGGEVLFHEIDADVVSAIPLRSRNVLLSKSECEFVDLLVRVRKTSPAGVRLQDFAEIACEASIEIVNAVAGEAHPGNVCVMVTGSGGSRVSEYAILRAYEALIKQGPMAFVFLVYTPQPYKKTQSYARSETWDRPS